MTEKICIENGCTKKVQRKTDKCIEHGGGLRCIISGCNKSASGTTDKCINHGGGLRCLEPECTKSARGKTNKCKLHGGGKRCLELDCKKSAQGNTDKCIEHGGGVRCVELGCTKAARGKLHKCIEHGGGKRCVEPDCKKGARNKTNKCIEHGGGKRCVENSCTKSAYGSSDACIEHGGGSRCVESGCTKSSIRKTNKCIEHGGGIRCPNCIKWPDSRGGSKVYDGYCATCFKQLFPTDERSKIVYVHTKEIRVRNIINTQFEGFIHDKPLYTGQCDCTHRRRIDHRKLIGGTLLCIETDENAHTKYDVHDEEIRYDDLFMIHSGKWVFIRFNPDKKGIDIVKKLDTLVNEIKRQIMRIENDDNIELLEIIKLYY